MSESKILRIRGFSGLKPILSYLVFILSIFDSYGVKIMVFSYINIVKLFNQVQDSQYNLFVQNHIVLQDQAH